MNASVIALDLTAGAGFLLVAFLARGSWRTSLLSAATGVLWLLGDVVPAIVIAHRGPLTHLLLSYPSGRLRSRVGQLVVVGVDVVSVFVPWGRLDVVAIAAAAAVVGAVVVETTRAPGGHARAAVRPVRAVLVLVWVVISVSSVGRLSGHGHDVASLVFYELAVIGSVTLLLVDRLHLRGRSATVAALAAGLGDAPAGSVRDVLAEALGDPTLRLWSADLDGHASDKRPDATRGQLPVRDGDRVLATIEHDPALLRDPQLRASVRTLVRAALRNQQLQEEAARRIAAVEASRRRLVAVADEERDDLEARLRTRVLGRIDHVTELLLGSGQPDQIVAQAGSCAESVRSFARGVHPRVIHEAGLEAALTDLTEAVSAELMVTGLSRSIPREIEVAVYYVCAEALANVAKYARATKATVRVHVSSSVITTIEDDGVGGATMSAGRGLGGLRDRVDALGGQLSLETPVSRGTRVKAVIPLPDSRGGEQHDPEEHGGVRASTG